MLAAVVHPHAIRLLAQDDAIADLAACPLDTTAPAAVATAAVTTASVIVVMVRIAIELAQAEARALR